MAHVGALAEEVVRCTRCGACRGVCPVFKELGKESSVARGRVQLVRAVLEGRLGLTPGYKERIGLCMLCKNCTAACPSGVKVDEIVRAAKADLVAGKGLSVAERMVFRVLLRNKGLFHGALGLGRLAQPLLFRRAPDGLGVLPRLPLGLDRRRLVAPIASVPLWRRVPEETSPRGARAGRVVYFAGCMATFVYPDLGVAAVNLLRASGAHVVVPRSQHCCGAPAYNSGDVETARIMAEHNVEVLSRLEPDRIVVTCSTCGMSLRKDFLSLLEGRPGLRQKAESLGHKVQDICEYLDESGHWSPPGRVRPMKVAYQDACHMIRGMGVREQPRRLLGSVKGIELSAVELGCCGSAGSFSLRHYDLSCRIADRMASSLSRAGVDAVATSCPACKMQIQDALYRNGLPVKAYHTAELLNMAYRAG